MAQETMYSQIVGDLSSTITAEYTAGTDTTISVANTAFLPSAPNLATIRKADKSALVTVKYTGLTATSLTGIAVVEGDSTQALTSVYAIGSIVSRPLCKADLDAVQNNITDHVGNTNNPHSVTPTQLGLGNVDNTSDEDKPVSTAQQTAINGVQSNLTAHVNDTNNPHEVNFNQINAPIASQSVLGVVKVGGGLEIDSGGSLSVSGETDPIYTITIIPSQATSSNRGVTITDNVGNDLSTQSARELIYKSVSRPVLLPVNNFAGVKVLQEDNLQKDLNGNTVVIDGSAGDVMRQFDPIYWTCTKTASSPATFEWKWSKRNFAPGSTKTAHLKNGGISPHVYVGIFNGVTITRSGNTCLASAYNTTAPANVVTEATLYDYANANGSAYNNMTHITTQLLILMNVFLYGCINFQQWVAQGYSTGGTGAASLHNATQNFSLTGGLTQGAVGSNVDATTGGIKNLYAHQFLINSGSIYYNGTHYLQYDQAVKRKISVGSSAVANLDGWVAVTLPISGTPGSYIATLQSNVYHLGAPLALDGTETTSVGDGCWYNNTGDMWVASGGDCSYGALCGLFSLSVNGALAASGWFCGGRLQAVE